MKNIPNKIYLQVGELTPDEVGEIDFTELSEVSWCSERIYKSDIEFVLSSVVKSVCNHNWIGATQIHSKCTKCGAMVRDD